MNELTNKQQHQQQQQRLNQNGNQSSVTSSPSSNNNNAPGTPQSINRPKLKYKNWCVQMEKKANGVITMLPQLDAIGSCDEKKRDKSINALNKVNAMLVEVVALLDITVYKPSSKNNLDPVSPSGDDLSSPGSAHSYSPSSPRSSPSTASDGTPLTLSPGNTSPPIGKTPDNSTNGLISTFNMIRERDKENGGGGGSSQKSTKVVAVTCRDTMLALWAALQAFIEKNYTLEKDFTPMYKTMLMIARRREYDSATSTYDPQTYKPWNNDILSKYRVKLYKTFSFIANLVSTTPYLSMILSQFCAKFIVIAFYRIPRVAKQLIDALVPPETEITDIITYYPCPPHLQHLNIVGDRPDKLPFHALLMQSDPASEKELDGIPQGWVDNVARKETIFFIFFKEWITVCKSVMGENVDMKTIPGFFTLAYALMHEIKTRDQPIPPVRPTPSIEAHYALIGATRNDSQILDGLIKIIFLKTCVFDLAGISSTLGIVELWFKEFGRLPDTFDIHFFCEGIDNIIAADHHQVVIRALNLIYNTSDSFQGPNRMALYCDLLLHKYFYTLFLHWDQPVRNAYHHLLLYRMVRINRYLLSQSGFSLSEYSKLTHSNSITTTKSLSPAKYPTEKDSGNASTGSGNANGNTYSSSSRLTSSTSSISVSKPRQIPTTPLPPIPAKKKPPPVPPRMAASSPPTTSIPDDQSECLDDSTIDELLEETSTTSSPSSPSSPSTSTSTSTSTTTSSPPTSTSTNITVTNTNNNNTMVSLEEEKEFNITPIGEYTSDKELLNDLKKIDLCLRRFELYIKNVSDQFRAPELKFHDPRLTNYVAPSLSEFKTYIAINNQASVAPPKIIPLMQRGPTPINFLKD
ncbi:hypothetical protein SAMD00019534_069540 [Acytostelium subglobosum LB1]|uniref:hypothetical protein n=1 Tax=Acytostelium subglobosum LB1 TaxID=1410327 RepID=UPI000644E97E|nr:hypothetical protein SAMD00019534_069540 [Acytostelium subglobosum LB1]GAM23779.1 hypothetical protein SAMD00019534_069540 [Acytostelium subglobosum LB1]|eukprot:XP_012753520.1 hypothetical protein SAMD00019534_069540 [Acytostelium subglobosum LB1]